MGRTPVVFSVFIQQQSFQERPEEGPISESLKWKIMYYVQKQHIEFYIRLASQGSYQITVVHAVNINQITGNPEDAEKLWVFK